MATRYLFVLVISSVFAGDNAVTNVANPAAAAPNKFTAQDIFLAQQAAGNFACRVNSVRVTTDNPGDEEYRVITPQVILSAFSSVATLEWAHIAQMSFAPMDGRNDEKVLATPGGDMGEFIQALNAYSKVAQEALTIEQVTTFFERYLKVMTRSKFTFQTDQKAYNNLVNAAGCRNLHVSEMGGLRHQKEALLREVAVPNHIGDPFLKFLAVNATALDLNPDYIQMAFTAYHKVLWTNPSKASQKLCYLMLHGSHTEAALINIKTPEFCLDQGLAPMVSQQFACPSPVVVNHADAVKILRRELVAVLTSSPSGEAPAVDPREVLAVYNQMAEANFEKFSSSFLGTKLPAYTVEFFNTSPLLRTDSSFIENPINA